MISIPASNYVEKARWALQLAKVPFEEDKFLPVVHAFNTRPKGSDTVPLLYFPSSKKALTDSTDILDFFAQELPSLYPNEEAKALELYYKELGPHVRKCGEWLPAWLRIHASLHFTHPYACVYGAQDTLPSSSRALYRRDKC